MDFDARLDLATAVRERDALRRRREEVVGSPSELQVSVALNAASARVEALDRYLSWSEDSPLTTYAGLPQEELESYIWAVR